MTDPMPAVPVPAVSRPAAVRTALARRLLTSAGARANAAQGLRDVRQQRLDGDEARGAAPVARTGR